jgi:VWFA-related protein
MMAPELHAHPIQRLSTSDRFNLREKETAGQRESSWFCFCPIKTVLLAALAAAGVLAAQAPQPKQNTAQDSGIVLRQTVRRVRVDVVVTDAKGHPVAGLQASDFRVAEDGKPQSIRQFEYRGDENAAATVPMRPPLPPHTFMNLPEAPEHGPLTVLLYDVLNTPLDAQLSARTQMVEFIRRSAGRRIAIFVLGDRLRLLQGFTSDTEQLERVANGSGTTAQRSAFMTTPPSGSEDMAAMATDAKASGDLAIARTLQRLADREANGETAYASYRLDRRVDITLGALAQIGRFLAGVPGRKNLIWFSASFPAGVTPDPDKSLGALAKVGSDGTNGTKAGSDSQIVDDAQRNYTERMRIASGLLNAAEVAIYPVDARGLQTNSFFSASQDTSRKSSRNAWSDTSKAGLSFQQQSAQEFATMDFLAEQTGGRAFYNTNGLEQAMEAASTEGSSYYSLLYSPTNIKFDGAVRRISVQLEHGNYHLAYRRSYLADDLDSGAQPQDASDAESASSGPAEADLQFGAPLSHQLIFAARVDAVGEPAPATAEQMAALAPYREQAAKAEHRKFVQPATPVPMQRYAVVYSVLARLLELPKSANGAYQSDISVAAMAFDKDGKTLWGTKTRLKDEIPASKIDNILKDGIRVVRAFFIPVETSVMRLVVYDEHSGRIGSMEIRLPLSPDQ